MTAQELKNSILMQAVQGKLVPQDPNDEPASVLLAKIRAEKEQMMKEGKIKKEPISEIYVDPSDNQHYEKVGKTVKCIEDEIPFQVPKGWEWCRMHEISGLITDGTHKTPKYVEKGIPFVSVKDISSGKLSFSDVKHITAEEHKTLIKRCKPEQGDVLVCRIGTLGKAIKITTDIEFSIFVSLGLIKIIMKEIADYIVLVLNSGYGKKWIDDNKVGGGTHTFKINLKDLKQMLIPLPPYSEQLKIIKKALSFEPNINEYASYYKSLSVLNKSIKEKLKKSILQYAIEGTLVKQNPEDEHASELIKRIRAEKEKLIKSGKLKKDKNESFIYRGSDNSYYEKFQNGKEICIDDEIPFVIPTSWTWVRLGFIGNWSSGATPSRAKPQYYGGTIPWLKTGDLNDGYIESVSENITDLALSETSVKLNPVGSILIAMYGATIGKLGIANIKLTTNQACCACLPFYGIYNEYLFYFLMSQKKEFIKRGEGGAQPNISKEKIISTLMPTPPLDEQIKIVATIKQIFEHL